MQLALRAVFIYLFLLVLTRVSGRRTLAQMTTFDLVLLLVIGEATQQALLGNDFSIVTALVVIATLVALDVALSLVKARAPAVDRVIEGVPVILLADGEMHRDRMERARVDESDILEAARQGQGLERLEQIRYAVLERRGNITVIPYRS